MLNKFDSPIVVKVETHTSHSTHPGQRRGLFGDYSDTVGIMLLCLTAYTFFLYCLMPANATHQYGRVVAELSYYWRSAWYTFEYQWYTAYLPTLASLWQNVISVWPL